MAFDLSSIKQGGTQRPPLIVIHGGPGVGKTCLAANAANPIFICTEDGLGNNNVDSFPDAESIDDVMSALVALYDDHGYKTLVIDSLSALEPMIWNKVAKDNDVDSIESMGFGRGYVFAMNYWQEMIKACQGLIRQKSMTVVLIAHSDVVRFDPPDGDSYDRYQLKMHKRPRAYIHEQADIIGFAHKPVYVKKENSTDSHGKAKPKG